MIWIKTAQQNYRSAELVAHRGIDSCHALPFHQLPPSAMPKKFRVISQAAPVAGKTKQDVHKALLKLNLKPEQIQLLLLKPLVIKKGLENKAALEYAERFSSAGLKVRIEAYEVAAPPEVTDEGKQRDHVYETLLKAFTHPVQSTHNAESDNSIGASALLGALPAPLLYGGLIVSLSFVLLWYLGSGHGLLFGGLALPPAAAIPLWLATWLLPALAGGCLLIGLLYPFWPTPIPTPHLRLDPRRHARFHHLVNQVTAAMDVAAPEFIEITPTSHVRVTTTPLARGDLRLTIGFAAVYHCSVSQLIGLIAGEFGRFSSPSSTRAAVWIHTINGWFAYHSRVPAPWDERFHRWMEAYPRAPIRGAIGALQSLTIHVRRLLARLTALNARTTERSLLKLEKEADRQHASVAGAAQFAATAEALEELMATEREIRQLNQLVLYGRDQLLRDLPAAIGNTVGQSSSASDRQPRAPQRLWEPHAPDAARIKEILHTPTSGVLSCALPARTLFADFDQLCDSVTLHDYHRQGIADADQLRVDNIKILGGREALLSQARINAIQQGERAPLNADGSVEWTAGRF